MYSYVLNVSLIKLSRICSKFISFQNLPSLWLLFTFSHIFCCHVFVAHIFCCHVFVAQTFPVAVSPSKKVASQRTQRNAFDFIPNIKNVTIRVSLKDSIIPRSVWLFSADITRAACFFRILIYCDFCTQLCGNQSSHNLSHRTNETERE